MNKKKYMTLLIVVGVALIAWSVGSWWVVKDIEEPAYTAVSSHDGYEVRQYEPYIIAETRVTGAYDTAVNDGFRIIANYIFGGNTKKEPIAMTAPVVEQTAPVVSEKIAMTVPVVETSAGDNEHLISFVMPSAYTLETLPTPDDSRVVLRKVEDETLAVLRFGWYATDARVEMQKEKLREFLERDGFEIVGEARVARYNPPFSAPYMQRNEILIPITVR